MNKKIKQIGIGTLVIMQLFLLCGCSNENSNEELKGKTEQEIQYLDNKIISMLNNLNRISMQNYDVEVKQVELENQSSSNKKSSDGSGQEPQGGQNAENESGGEKDSTSVEQKSSTITSLQMKPDNVLVTARDNIQWTTIKSDIESIYLSWNNTILDLYKLNVNSDNILGFSKDLDATTVAIKNEDKTKSLTELANLYGYLTKYLNEFSTSNGKKNVFQTKSNILNAYALVEQENWNEISNQLLQAEQSFTNVINDIEYINKKESKVNKVYIALKELQNCVAQKDKDVFYIKYKNVMEDLTSL